MGFGKHCWSAKTHNLQNSVYSFWEVLLMSYCYFCQTDRIVDVRGNLCFYMWWLNSKQTVSSFLLCTSCLQSGQQKLSITYNLINQVKRRQVKISNCSRSWINFSTTQLNLKQVFADASDFQTSFSEPFSFRMKLFTTCPILSWTLKNLPDFDSNFSRVPDLDSVSLAVCQNFVTFVQIGYLWAKY